MLYKTTCKSPVGKLTLTCDGDSLTGLWIEGQKHHGDTGAIAENHNLPIFTAAEDWLNRYFAGERPDISALSLKPEGSEFRIAVWKLLCEIPYGKCITYGDIARALGKEKCAQAVGGAVGNNPISIIIPCHRVIGANGSLTGYAAGVDKKKWLLEHEGLFL